ncbi:hypothetical protein [Methylobacterium platani]|uniref:DUF4164 domain-containing protein n=2 Tax=Methylobacterium platani TaxID=427683 RepID=A0A179SB05_9HYPH|nr:hypothetical protein [Methylobacterium platani]KMO20944.1 hypothetical protein SQ03_04530 [Methylobacterium platani JCM 14648]OAS23341.1 hypothetical protein A5481_16880 [Methylobacterium platani]
MERSRKGQETGRDTGSRETGSDVEALKRLEALQPAFERLRADRIRAESDVERLTAELAAARAQAREELGTDDEAEIHRMIEEARAENARRVEDFAQALRAVQDRLAALDAGR